MNKAYLGAIRKGMEARECGEQPTANPYRDRRKKDGRLTWSRAFQLAWDAGYQGTATHNEKEAIAAMKKKR